MTFKLICFDLDGTIVDQTIFVWQTIHDALGTDKDKRQILMDDFFSGMISYEDWARGDIEAWKELGATKDKLMGAIKPLKLMQGARETLQELKKQGYKLAIISGSLNFVLDHVMPDYKEYFDHVYINTVEFNEDGSIKDVIPTPFDFQHKVAALNKICEKENIKPEECVFVGDHDNDVHIADLAGKSIAFNCKSDRLAQIADVIIKDKDLSKILEHIK